MPLGRFKITNGGGGRPAIDRADAGLLIYSYGEVALSSRNRQSSILKLLPAP